MKTDLPRFEGRNVQVGSLRLTGKVHERVGALAKDEEVFLIVKGTVTEITHGDIRVNGADLYGRKHTVKASALVLIERDQGGRMLDEATMLAGERFGVVDLFHQDGDGDGN